MEGRATGFLPEVSRNLFWILFGFYLVVRFALLFAPGYEVDVVQYKGWALGSGLMGLPAVYERTSADYPPASLFVFWVVGKAFLASQPPFAPGTIPNDVVPTALIKLPHLFFDLLLGALLYRIVALGGLWRRASSAHGHGRLASLLYWWNPAVLFGSAYWGQFDAMHAFLAVASIAALGGDRLILSAGCLAAAGLTKPLAAPLVPLLALAAWLRRGLRGVIVAGVSGLVVAIAFFLPFLTTGRGEAALSQVLFDLNAMPQTSVNAHNMFWWFGAWVPADAPWLGPFSAQTVGLFLFASALVVVLIRSLSWLRRASGESYRAGLFVIAAAVVCCFFFFSTHMHENHLFLAVPLLIAVAGRSRRLALLALGASIAVFANEFLHDPVLPTELPGFLGSPSDVMDPHMQRPYTSFQLFGTYANSVLVACIALGTFLEALRLSRRDGGSALEA